MQAEMPNTQAGEETGKAGEQRFESGTDQPVRKNIHEVLFIRNPRLNRVFTLLPWVSIVVGTFGMLVTIDSWRPSAVMFYSGMGLVIVALFIFQILAKRVSQVFMTIWTRNIVGIPEIPAGSTADQGTTDAPSSTRASYEKFLKRFEDTLNHPVQWMVAVIFTALVFLWEKYVPWLVIHFFSLLQFNFWAGLATILEVALEFLFAFMAGLLVWRMIVIGVYIWRLGWEFKLLPQLGHPDACGGLEPVGNLCLWMILLIGLAGFFLGGWILPSQLIDADNTDHLYRWYQQSESYKDIFLQLLLIPIGVSIVSFFVPLWSVHQAMDDGQAPVRKRMDEISESITRIESRLLKEAGTLDLQQVEELNNRLKILREVYQRDRKYPTWPFNAGGLTKFFSIQLLPLVLSLANLYNMFR